MRVLLVVTAVLLGGCVLPEPTREDLESRCRTGETQACAAVMRPMPRDAYKQATLAAARSRMGTAPAQTYRTRQGTTCVRLTGGGMVCE